MPRPLWTAEQAREMAKRGAYARWHAPKPVKPPEPAKEPLPEWRPDAQLVRVNSHVERVHDLLEASTDAMEIDRLSRALNTLLDRARILAGVPLVKPAAAQRTKPATNAEPI